MCGVFAVVRAPERRVSACALVFEACTALEYRGYDSAGVAWRHGRELQMRKEVGSMRALAASYTEPPEASQAMGHTRWATHGRPSVDNAHPIQVGRFTLVHNGIIDDHERLRARCMAMGHHFLSETDTESLVATMALRAGSEQIGEEVLSVLKECAGQWSVVWMDEQAPDCIYAYAHGRPLWVGYAEAYGSMISSDVMTLVPYTDQCASVAEGMWVKLTQDGIYYHHDDGWMLMHYEAHGLQACAYSKSGFDSYMLKEMSEQATVLAEQYQHYETDPQMDAWIDMLRTAKEIVFLACGSSYYAASVARYVIERHLKVRVCVEVASEFRYREPVLVPGTCVIAISQSGETADTLSAAQWVQSQGGKVAALCNVAGSALARMVDQRLLLHAGPEISVASTKAFSAQVFALLYLTYRAMGQRLPQHAMARLCEAMREQLQYQPHYLAVAKALASYDHVLYIGRDQAVPMAYEGALKLKEISYIHAEAYPAGELKHGPIALIDPQCPTLALVERKHAERMGANIQEIKARSGPVFVLGPVPDSIVPWSEAWPEFFEVMGFVIPLQMIAYHAAKARGYDVDRPRNLAKSVTVE